MDFQNLECNHEEIEQEIEKIIEEALLQCAAYQELISKNETSKSARKTNIRGKKKLEGIEEELQSTEPTERRCPENSDDDYFASSDSSDKESNSQRTQRFKSYENPLSLEDNAANPTTFTCEWCFGVNLSTPVICPSEGVVIFAAGHMIAQYDFKNSHISFNHAHEGKITHLHLSKSLLGVCDDDTTQPVITLWDTKTLKIQHSLKIPSHVGGFKFVALDQTASTIFAVTSGPPYYFIYWQISTKNPAGFCKLTTDKPVNLGTAQDCAIITCQHQIWIICLEAVESITLLQAAAAVDSGKLGKYRVSCSSGLRILTGTSGGQIVVHEINGNFVKTVRLHHSGITCMETVENMVIIGFEDGWLAAYHTDLKLRNTLHIFPAAINSISILDVESRMGSYAYTLMSGEVGFVSRNGEIRKLSFPNQPIKCIDSHPHLPQVIMAYSNGQIVLMNTEEKSKTGEKLFPCRITSIKYSSTGTIVAMGTENGDILILDTISLATMTHLENLAGTAITRMVFHSEKNTMAFSYENCGIGLLSMTEGWHLKGKYRPHFQNIVGFTLVGDLLYSIGHDRMLAVLNTDNMLQLLSRHQIEQTALPTALAHHNGQLLIANTEQKIRFFDMKSQLIVKIVRSPGKDPIHYMTATANKLVFATGANISVCPLPWQGWAPLLRGHGQKVSQANLKENIMISSSKGDNILQVWSLNTQKITREVKLPEILQQKVHNLFKKGPIPRKDLLENLQFIGFFPSKFDKEIILREYRQEILNEIEFQEILFNYGPPPGITEEKVRESVMSISDPVRGVVHMDKLIQAVTSAQTEEAMTEEEAVKCLRALFRGEPVPSTISTDKFITDVLGFGGKVSK